MGGEQATLLQTRIDPLPKIIVTEATVNERLGKIQEKERYQQTSNNDP